MRSPRSSATQRDRTSLTTTCPSRVADPAATFRRVVPVALAVSLIPDVLIWANGAYGAATAETVLPLMAMHVAAALTCATLLPRLAEARRPSA